MLRLDAHGVGEGGRSRRRCSARSAARTADSPSRTRSTCASGRGRRARLRHPGRPRAADLRRVSRGARYAADNPLIGYPLAYQYLTSLRADALPANADELLRMRGRGWLSNFSVGNWRPARGVPLVSAFRWDTGVQVHAGNRRHRRHGIGHHRDAVEPARSTDDNGGRQLAGRVALHPDRRPGRRRAPPRAGRSSARARVRAAARRGARRRLHADGVGRRRRVFARLLSAAAETVVSRLDAAGCATRRLIELPLRAVATSVEGRYKIRPGLYVGRARRSSGVQRRHRRNGHDRAGTRRSRASKSAAATRSSAICC